jgi:uncharacterized membrane protein
MILHYGPDAPLLLRAAAGAALVLHIGGGATGIAAGWTAMLTRKGERLHRVAGTAFFLAMLTMSGVAAVVAPMLPEAQWTNTTAAVFTFYLVATAWATVRRGEGQVGRFERIAVLVPLGIAAMGLALAVNPPGEARADGAFGAVYAIAVISALAAVCDLMMIRRGGIAGPARIARHLWRMSTGLFVATGSFFVGQPRFVPTFLKDTGLNVVPLFVLLALLVFWMLRVRLQRTPKAPVLAPAE